MSVDKSIDYVNQDGYKNYTKNSDSVTVPRKFKARKNAPSTKLAYITDAEEKQLKKQNPGTPHKGPSNVPSYDSFDAQGNFTSGAAMSAMESGSTNARDRAEVQASNYGAPSGAGPGVKTQAEQDLRSSIIAAGAGQRVNPGFFDSRNVVSPAELAAAKEFNPTAFRQNRGGGIMDFIRSGGLLGNLVRGLGQRLGLGKRFNQPTYDMRQFSDLGLLTDRVTPSYYDDLDNEGLLSLINDTNLNDIDLGNPTGDDRIVPEEQGLEGDGSFKISSTLPSNSFSSDVNPLFRNMITRTGGLQDPVTTKLNEQKDKIEALQKSDAYEFLSEDQKNQLQKDLQEIINDLNLKQVATSIET